MLELQAAGGIFKGRTTPLQMEMTGGV